MTVMIGMYGYSYPNLIHVFFIYLFIYFLILNKKRFNCPKQKFGCFKPLNLSLLILAKNTKNN